MSPDPQPPHPTPVEPNSSSGSQVVPPEPLPNLVNSLAQRITPPTTDPAFLPLAGALKPKQIDALIELQSRREEHRHQEAMAGRSERRKVILWSLGIVLGSVCVISGLALGFNHPEYATGIVGSVLGVLGIAFGAYQYGKGKRRTRSPRRPPTSSKP
jgi:hypothetical protein